MLREIGDWFAALFVVSAITVALLGVGEWLTARNEADAVETTADAFTVALDAGHGGFDAGASGTATGTKEAGLNLIVAQYLEKKLEAYGIVVVMTREDGAALGGTKKKDLARRREIISQESIDLVVSIHMNKFSDTSISGAMAFYQKGSVEGQKLAQRVIDEVCETTARKRRLANPGDYFILRECACPAVLVECGFLSNAEEEQKLLDEAYLESIADAIARGVLGYLSVT